MRAEGYEVLAEVREIHWPLALASVAGHDEEALYAVPALDVSWVLGATPENLVGQKFLATMRETPQTGPVLSGFRPVPPADAAAAGTEMTVRCLLLAGDQAELVAEDGDDSDVARWPAAAIAEQTGLQLEDLPGKRFRTRVTEQEGRVLFSGFTLQG